ncbi:hypothetical protein [Shewanella sp. MBTL60-007]|uniref:hypothetical protein n=1 Tax=Shewanella sp. MBTL60-007 TaxID=2815911 RepID=UPI001BB9B77A|nr:hypothetical protein [Shewanella sp. MBTL60-007]GIU22215.1 hypothetical protein TUM3792_24060 [Shewanella sp. MBTL60-007]
MSKAQAQKMVDAYIAAELDVLDGKTVTVNGKTMGTEDLQAIRAGRLEWERRVNAYSSPNAGFGQAQF